MSGHPKTRSIHWCRRSDTKSHSSASRCSRTKASGEPRAQGGSSTSPSSTPSCRFTQGRTREQPVNSSCRAAVAAQARRLALMRQGSCRTSLYLGSSTGLLLLAESTTVSSYIAGLPDRVETAEARGARAPGVCRASGRLRCAGTRARRRTLAPAPSRRRCPPGSPARRRPPRRTACTRAGTRHNAGGFQTKLDTRGTMTQ
jgi:hypothetical protein